MMSRLRRHAPFAKLLAKPSLLLFAGLLVVTAYPAHGDPTHTRTLGIAGNSSTWGCGGHFPIYWNGGYNATYLDGLPAGAKVTDVVITMGMAQSPGNSVPTNVRVSLNGQSIGSAVAVSGRIDCPYLPDLTAYQFQQAFPQSLSGYSAGGSNNFGVTVEAGCLRGYGT